MTTRTDYCSKCPWRSPFIDGEREFFRLMLLNPEFKDYTTKCQMDESNCKGIQELIDNEGITR